MKKKKKKKNIKRWMLQQNKPIFILTQKQKRVLTRVTLMMHLNKSIIRLYQTPKNILEKFDLDY